MKPRLYVPGALCLFTAMQSFAANPGGVGSNAPPIDLQQVLHAPEGARATLEGLRGKLVVLEFWATWCPSCVKAIPHFNELADQLKDRPVQFISITDHACHRSGAAL